MNKVINEPNVEPSRQQGTKMYTKLKLTNEVGMVGCFLTSMEK